MLGHLSGVCGPPEYVGRVAPAGLVDIWKTHGRYLENMSIVHAQSNSTAGPKEILQSERKRDLVKSLRVQADEERHFTKFSSPKLPKGDCKQSS